jgi:hypothetical protein
VSNQNTRSEPIKSLLPDLQLSRPDKLSHLESFRAGRVQLPSLKNTRQSAPATVTVPGGPVSNKRKHGLELAIPELDEW